MFDGEAALGLVVDMEKAVGLKGGILNASALVNYGHGPSATNIDNLNVSVKNLGQPTCLSWADQPG